MTQTNAHVAIMHASSTRHGSPTNPRYANTTKSIITTTALPAQNHSFQNTLSHLAYHPSPHPTPRLTCVPNFPFHARACPVHYHYAV
ncbi:hypothetical protein HBH56_099730 [Parastagonospora nodorum]|uniref:Uncharacterized protein n=1 Tax=Phaeosphaeria nodorum (strain SN15 / ATCC MYA-4574 / FGSC 10173) TaxID=321614 RepID=A0A7U2ICR3_PHANO|nr:hypothetical protein HBH56_099730 [Parastagonospora nodorum]QRD07474.1 hypothetical protein JI435_424430 [Parastagonospora nodorum SN15]KAH3930510.1 hypothetical protein HBH54_114050 [Parastagonospora nodorum]KAH4070316.1 hypothetical protein HBH50_097270 [Parastagonospora nodorum]KAH4090880.1 hypothetical protein HBH48_101040 [Parastagonospora nodorum]